MQNRRFSLGSKALINFAIGGEMANRIGNDVGFLNNLVERLKRWVLRSL